MRNAPANVLGCLVIAVFLSMGVAAADRIAAC